MFGFDPYKSWEYTTNTSSDNTAAQVSGNAGSYGALVGVDVSFDDTPTGGVWSFKIGNTNVARFDRTSAGEGERKWFKVPADSNYAVDVPQLGAGVASTINVLAANL